MLFRLESPIHAPRISVFGGLPPKFRGNSFRPQQCTSLHDFTSFELSHVKIHPRVWPVGIREPEKKGINKNIICYDTHLSKSPQWVDLYQIWCRGSTGGRNQLCWLFCWSGHRQGYRVCGGGGWIEGRRWHWTTVRTVRSYTNEYHHHHHHHQFIKNTCQTPVLT